MLKISFTSKGKLWEWRHSIWIVWTFTVLLNWIAFLYIGIRARQKKWILWGLGYLTPILLLMPLPEEYTGTLQEEITYAVFLISTIACIVHSFVARKEYLLRLEARALKADQALRNKIQKEYNLDNNPEISEPDIKPAIAQTAATVDNLLITDEPTIENNEPETTIDEMPAVIEKADFISRFFATIIDNIMVNVPLRILLAIFIFILRNSSKNEVIIANTIYGVVQLTVVYGYFSFYAYFSNGQTLGKKWNNIRITDMNGDNLTIGRFILREFIARGIVVIGSLFIGLYANLWVLTYLLTLSKGKRALHDMIAGTQVIKTSDKKVHISVAEDKSGDTLKIFVVALFSLLIIGLSVFYNLGQKDYVYYYNEAFKSYKSGQVQKAMATLDKAFILKPNSPKNYYLRGEIYLSQHKYNDALTNYNKAIQLDPGNAKYYNERGYTLQMMGQFEEALQNYNNAIELNPKLEAAYNNKSFVLNDLGRYQEALIFSEKAIALNPSDFYPYINKGLSYYKMGQFNESIINYDKALEINPKSALALYNKAVSLYKMGREDETIECLKKALIADPNYESAREALNELQGNNSNNNSI